MTGTTETFAHVKIDICGKMPAGSCRRQQPTAGNRQPLPPLPEG